jgi:hypothetical protein
MKPTLKSWATPLVISAFTISAVTGVLMFFHKDEGLVKPVHEWLSWALVAGGVFHTAAHWKAFKSWFSRKSSLAIIATGAIVTITAIAVPSKGGHGNPFMRVNRTLSTASVETLAPVVKLTPEQAVAKLEQKGLKVDDASHSIKEIAVANGSEEQKVILALFE